MVNTVGFPVPELVDDGKIVKYTDRTHVGAGKFTETNVQGQGHDAVDIYTREVRREGKIRVGSDVVAIADGFAQLHTSRSGGFVLELTFFGADGKKYSASYRHLSHVDEKFLQKERGKYPVVKVEQGEVIGQVGNTGNVLTRGIPYPILCFAMTCNGKPIDPYKVFFKVPTGLPRVSMDLEHKQPMKL